MAENMRGLNFLLEGKVNEWLAGRTKAEEIDGFMIDDGDSFSIDIIEQPFHCEASAQDGDAMLALYVRNELSAYMEPDLSIVIRADNEKPEIKRSGRIGGDSTKQLLVFMQAASVLKKYGVRNDFAKKYADFDTDREAIIVTIEDDEPKFQRVRGKKRPPLSVRTMTGSIELGRPYADELISEYGLSDFETTIEAAEDGNVDAMNEVALAYINGKPEEDVEPDLHKAFYWAKQLAKAKEPAWMKRTALFYATGKGTEPDLEEAVHWLRLAEEEGEENAGKLAVQFASMAANEKKAEEGDADAMAELAAEYMMVAGSRGETGFEGDYSYSRRWAEKSVEFDSGFGCWVLGLLYEHGRGVDKDLEKAAELYRRGADLGNREAQNNLGTFLMNGMGVPQDRKQAFHLFKESAKQGYGVAMRNLGNCYQYAYGTDGNMRKAVEWYEKALQELDDPELEQKVKIFREMGDSDPEWDTDYPEAEEIEQEAEALNGPLKAALKAQGMPTDEEYINSLPAEEVFALLASLENGGKYIPPVKQQAEPVNEPEQPQAETESFGMPETMPEITEEAAAEQEPAAPVSEPEPLPAAEPEQLYAEPEAQPEPAVFEEPAAPVSPSSDYMQQDEDRLLDEIFAMPDFAEGRDMAKIFEVIDKPAVKEAEPEPQEPEIPAEEPEERPAEMTDAQDIPAADVTAPEPEPVSFAEPAEPEAPAELPPLEDFIAEEDIEEAAAEPAENPEPETEVEPIDEAVFPFTEAPKEPEPEPEPEPEDNDETVVAEAKYVIEEIRSPKETDVVVSDIMKDEFIAMLDEVSTFDENEDLFPEPKEPEPFDERLTEADVRKTVITNPLYHLTYAKGKSGGNSKYTIALPDGFTGEWNAEGRDFIAWLPWGDDVSDYRNSPIAFYAGPETGENNIDTRLLEPSICAILTEQNYWNTERQRLLSEKNRIIVMDESHPAGCIIAGYDEGEFAYNINIVMPGHIKTMRVQVLGADDEDIPDCDRMVLDWVKTLHSDEAIEAVKNLNDPAFTAQPLNEELAAAWKKAGDIRYTIMERRYRDTAALCRERLEKGVYGAAGEEAFRNDLQNNLDRWAEEFGAFLNQGVSGIEAFRSADPENPLLTALCDIFRPVLETETERKETTADEETVLTASVKNIEELRTRFAKLDEELLEEERLRNLAAFREPLYESPKNITIGGLEGLLPDGMITLAEAQPEAHTDPEFLEKLRSIYTMAAIPGDYEGGFDRYTEGAFCVNLGSPVKNSGFGVLFDSETPETAGEHLIQFLTANLKRNNRYNANYPAEYVCGGKEFSIVCAQTEGNVNEKKRGASFVYLILDKDDLYQGNAYFNSVGTDEQFRSAMHAWLKTFKRAESEEPKNTEQFKTADPEAAVQTRLNSAEENRTEGADIAYVPLTRLTGKVEDNDVVEAAAEDPNSFAPAETAVQTAELFRVAIGSFDPAHDREQEIRSGLIRNSRLLHAFRSFVWTLKAWSEEKGAGINEAGIEVLEQLAGFIADRNGLNYTAGSYFPALCSADDINVCYMSDTVSEDAKHAFTELLNAKNETSFAADRICSLDSLRSELAELEPVMRTISDALEKNRNREEQLTGGLADVLYVWCALACAAKKPFLAEEGPASCHWEHPNAFAQVQRSIRVEKLTDELIKEHSWLKHNRRVLERKPDISLKDALFVFTGAAALEEYPAIIAKLEEQGGILRNAVSARTDYVVVNPSDAGETKINAAIEQQKNGNPVKIVLLNDLRRVLGMPEMDIRKELEALNVDIDVPEFEDEEPEEELIEAIPETAETEEPVAEEAPAETAETEPAVPEETAEEDSSGDSQEEDLRETVELPESFDQPVLTDTDLETMILKAMEDSPLTEDPGILIPDIEEEEKSEPAEPAEAPAENEVSKSTEADEISLDDALAEALNEEMEEVPEAAEPEEVSAESEEPASEASETVMPEETTEETQSEEAAEAPVASEPEEVPAESVEPVIEETLEETEESESEEPVETPAEALSEEAEETQETTEPEEIPAEAEEPVREASEDEVPAEPADETAGEEAAEQAAPEVIPAAAFGAAVLAGAVSDSEENPQTPERSILPEAADDTEASAETQTEPEEPVSEVQEDTAVEDIPAEPEEMPEAEENRTEEDSEDGEPEEVTESDASSDTAGEAAEETVTEESSEAPEEPEAEEAETEPAEEETAEEPEETPEETEPEDNGALKAEALNFLKEKEEELNKFKTEWDTFSELSSKTLMHKIRAGMKPKLSADESGSDRTMRMNLSFDNDTTEVKKFIDSIPEKVDRRKEKLSEGIRTFDAKLRELTEQGLDEITTLKLCRLFTDFKNTGRNLSLRFTSRDVHYSLDEDVDAIGKEWEEKYEASRDKLEEAEKEDSEGNAAETEEVEEQKEPLPLKEEKEAAPEPAPLRFATSKTVKKTLAEEEAKQREEEQKTKMMNLQKETEQRIQEQLAEEKAEEQKARDKKKMLLIIALILILLCALAAGYYYMQNYMALENGDTDVMHNSGSEYTVSVLTADSPEAF